MENTITKMNEGEIDNIFEEMRHEKAADKMKTEAATKAKESFKPLPNGNYTGRVFVLADTVSNEKSPNYRLKKYVFKLTVIEGEFKGNMAYYHHVIMPHYLATPPASSAVKTEIDKWRGAVKLYMKKTDEILENCGIDTSDVDKTRFVQKIAANNQRRTNVNFTMKDGHPYINYPLIKPVEDDENSLFVGNIPDGNDMPLN